MLPLDGYEKTDIDKPETREALDLLEPHMQPEWLIPQFRSHLQPQVLRAAFLGICDSVKELIGEQMDALARQFAETHDMKVKAEIDRMSSELVKLDRLWVFVAR